MEKRYALNKSVKFGIEVLLVILKWRSDQTRQTLETLVSRRLIILDYSHHSHHSHCLALGEKKDKRTCQLISEPVFLNPLSFHIDPG